jgi:PIN domain nuclease of toxin-antitoxin system
LILLDTHVLLWLDSADPRLGAEARRAIDEAHQAGELAVSAISFWETAMLIEKGRLQLDIPAHAWRQDLLSAGLHEIAMDGEIGIAAATLAGFHGDPADRLITSSALVRGDRLLTADEKILDWEGALQRQDARR